MKSTVALILAAIALVVSLTGVGRSGAADPGVLEYCIDGAQPVQRVGVTIDGRYRLVYVNASVKALGDKHLSTLVIPTMRKSCVTP